MDGLLAVPEGPGLGVEIDEETIARFRAADGRGE
jgi:L-alanine-DL-glutamate epimerase-like enolase superfamily enzyme